jgi:hypothetical protein
MEIAGSQAFRKGVDGPDLVSSGREFRMELELFHRPYYINFLGSAQKVEDGENRSGELHFGQDFDAPLEQGTVFDGDDGG